MQNIVKTVTVCVLLAGFSLVLSSCGGGGGGGGGTADTTPPTISDTYPANGAIGVAVNTAVTATFSESLDMSSLNESTFTLKTGSVTVTGGVVYDITNKIARFTPASNLFYNTTYTATITTGVKDSAGNAMTADKVWSFTTGATVDQTAPRVDSASPAADATDASVYSPVTATFSETMNSTTIDETTFTLEETISGKAVTGTVTYSGTTATFTPSPSLNKNLEYTATIKTGVKDLAGNPMVADKVWSFTTVDIPGGTLDTSFGGVGYVTTNIGASYEPAYAVAVQADGKIVVAGASDQEDVSLTWFDFAVARYNLTGTLDTTFGNNGIVTTDIGDADEDYAYAVAIQVDGKIVVAGTTYNLGTGYYDFAVVRYNADGTRDTKFGPNNNGIVTTDVSHLASGGSSDFDDEALAVAIQKDGKIVVAGYVNNGGNYDFAVVRYNANGSLDDASDADSEIVFGTDGIATTDIGTFNDEAYSVAIQTDGKIVVAGLANNGADDDFAVVRYNSDGSLDTTDFSGGKVITDIGSGSSDIANAIALQSDGMIVVAGDSDAAGSIDFTVVRYDTNGSLDSTFGSGGIVITDINSGDIDTGFGVAVQGDGKIIVAGDSAGTARDVAIVRYTSTGAPDTSFGTNGIVTQTINEYDYTNAVAIQPDGKIVVVGETFTPSGFDSEFFVLRYWP